MASKVIVEHVTVYRQPGRFAGWPANYGMWSFGDELVIVFVEGSFKNLPNTHKRDPTKPFQVLQARSVDGGRTWQIEPFNGLTPKNRAFSADEHMIPELWIGNPFEGENPPCPLDEPIDFTDPETVVMVARTTCKSLPAPVFSWFYVSRDRCRSWRGPYMFTGLPDSLLLAGRTDIVPLSRHRALFMLTVHKSNGSEGRVCCVETCDGGKTFAFRSWLGDTEPSGFEIMPSTVRFPDGRLLTATRQQDEFGMGSIGLYESIDDGASWHRLPSPVPATGHRSNPPAMLRLLSGRVVLIYGYRNPPYSIRARISDDEGRSWSKEIILRDDGGDWDIGYPRAVLRYDGKVVIAYYFNTHTDGERFIAATIWDAENV